MYWEKLTQIIPEEKTQVWNVRYNTYPVSNHSKELRKRTG